MKKVKIKTKLESIYTSEEKEFIGTLSDNVLSYDDDNIKVAVSLDNVIITRLSDDYELIMPFETKTKNNFVNRILNNDILIETYCESIKKDKYSLEIEYYISDNKYTFQLNYEVVK